MKSLNDIITHASTGIKQELYCVDKLIGNSHENMEAAILKIVKAAILETASSNYNMDLLCSYAKEKLQQDLDDSVNEIAALEIIKLTEKIGFKDLAEKMY
jgi:hypothetical protein